MVSQTGPGVVVEAGLGGSMQNARHLQICERQVAAPGFATLFPLPSNDGTCGPMATAAGS
jgi:hypothetical protein